MALIEYLVAKPLDLPHVIRSASAPEKGAGTLTVGFREGDLFLENEDGRAYRLSWTCAEPMSNRTRSLPAGVYRLRTYRICGQKNGESWHISGTAPTVRKITVRAGENVAVDIDERITLKKRIGKRSVSVGIGGDKGVGLTIYREQKRIDMGYRLMNRANDKLAAGSMRYG